MRWDLTWAPPGTRYGIDLSCPECGREVFHVDCLRAAASAGDVIRYRYARFVNGRAQVSHNGKGWWDPSVAPAMFKPDGRVKLVVER